MCTSFDHTSNYCKAAKLNMKDYFVVCTEVSLSVFKNIHTIYIKSCWRIPILVNRFWYWVKQQDQKTNQDMIYENWKLWLNSKKHGWIINEACHQWLQIQNEEWCSSKLKVNETVSIDNETWIKKEFKLTCRARAQVITSILATWGTDPTFAGYWIQV